jgi:hypothetical protein
MRKIALLGCLQLAACATVMNRGPVIVPIESEPPGATVTYISANVGITPCSVAMGNHCSQVTLSMPGYQDQVVEVGRGTNGWVLGNLLLGGVVGMAVDSASGASGVICSKPVVVALTPLDEPKADVWTRPVEPTLADDEGWLKPGEVAPKPKATRAKPWKPRPVDPDKEGWMQFGDSK